MKTLAILRVCAVCVGPVMAHCLCSMPIVSPRIYRPHRTYSGEGESPGGGVGEGGGRSVCLLLCLCGGGDSFSYSVLISKLRFISIADSDSLGLSE